MRTLKDNQLAMTEIYDHFDIVCADKLGVDLETYVRTIESTSEKRMSVVVNALLEGDSHKVEKAKRIFNLIKQS